jgi:hypothetical protein
MNPIQSSWFYSGLQKSIVHTKALLFWSGWMKDFYPPLHHHGNDHYPMLSHGSISFSRTISHFPNDYGAIFVMNLDNHHHHHHHHQNDHRSATLDEWKLLHPESPLLTKATAATTMTTTATATTTTTSPASTDTDTSGCFVRDSFGDNTCTYSWGSTITGNYSLLFPIPLEAEDYLQADIVVRPIFFLLCFSCFLLNYSSNYDLIILLRYTLN